MAARMIRSGETVILDAGSTAMAVALALPDDLRDVLVVTSSLDVVMALSHVRACRSSSRVEKLRKLGETRPHDL